MTVEVRTTQRFERWLEALKDRQARVKILFAIRKLSLGNLGDLKPVGEGVSECRIHAGPGYRLYFVRRGQKVLVLLCGGDKSSQDADIRLARCLSKEVRCLSKEVKSDDHG